MLQNPFHTPFPRGRCVPLGWNQEYSWGFLERFNPCSPGDIESVSNVLEMACVTDPFSEHWPAS